MKEELLELNQEIDDMMDEYINAKMYYETKKAELLLGTDFGAVLGKAKPTVAEKEAYLSLELKDDKANYKYIKATVDSLKRKLEILLMFVGDD